MNNREMALFNAATDLLFELTGDGSRGTISYKEGVEYILDDLGTLKDEGERIDYLKGNIKGLLSYF